MAPAGLLVALATATFAVRGTVLDEKTSKPVPDATVVIKLVPDGERLTAVTDIAGRFEIPATEGTYLVAVVREGYFSPQPAEYQVRDGQGELALALRPDECAQALEDVFDHLEPESPPSNELNRAYYRALRRLLLPDLPARPDPSAFAFLLIPSFSAEESVSLEERNGSAVVVARKMEKHLWPQGESTWELPLATSTATVSIAQATATQLRALWKAALADSRKKPEQEGGCIVINLDGETYSFYSGGASATTWSPRRGTKMAGLVGIAQKLADLARAPAIDRVRLEEQLRIEVSSLLARFGLPLTPP